MVAGSKDDQIAPATHNALEVAEAELSPIVEPITAAQSVVPQAESRQCRDVGLNTTVPRASPAAGDGLLSGQHIDVEESADNHDGGQSVDQAGSKPESGALFNDIDGKPQPSMRDAVRTPEGSMNQNGETLRASGLEYSDNVRGQDGDAEECGGQSVDLTGSMPKSSAPFNGVDGKPQIPMPVAVRIPEDTNNQSGGILHAPGLQYYETGRLSVEEPSERAIAYVKNIDVDEDFGHSDLDAESGNSSSELEFKALMRAKSEGTADNDPGVRRSSRRTVPVRRWSSSEESGSSGDGGGNEDPDDEDYTGSRTKPKRRRSRKKARRKKKPSLHVADVGPGTRKMESDESESDGDWLDHDAGQPRKLRRRNKRKNRNKRLREIGQGEGNTAPTRVSTRIGRRNVRYSEANVSDSDIFDSDDASASRAAKDSVENDNDSSIERVVDFRAAGSEENTSSVKAHSVSDFDPDSVEFRVKWKNKSYRLCSWHKLDDLRVYKGFQRVLNYVKIFSDHREYYNSTAATPEEREESIITMQEHRDNAAAHEIIDRVIAERPVWDDPFLSEYLVKWKNLDYSESTWELSTELNSDADMKALDGFAEREQAPFSSKRRGVNPFNIRDGRPRFRRMSVQPKYLHGEERSLREYQLAGLNWLCFSWTKHNNVILADEMGLGKTLQTVAFLGWLMYVQKIEGPFLVVVPLSTSASWVREFQRWLPDVNVVNYVGDGASRATIREHEFWHSRGRGNSVKFQVLLTTPELVMLDEEYIDEVRWAALAVDEAHRLKNEHSALHKTLKSFRSATRLLITGTPLQNSVRELWALLHFLNPDTFPDADSFEDKFSFSALRDPEKVSELHNTLRPYIIRRQKTDVEKSLPKKSYAVLRVGMSSSQQEYYKLLYTKNFAKLNAGVSGNSVGPTMTLRNLVMELKKCCNHPFLFPRFFQSNPHSTVKSYIRGSGKLILLDKLLLRLREKGHRVLIFSQMVTMLDILQEYCHMRGFPHQRLDGTMHNDIRQRSIDHYNAPGSTDFLFLLSTRAGGLGINLATADTVIIFDSDWNPQNDLQAESRAHRIGQKKDVKVFRFVTRDSVEEDILERAKRKRVLEHLVIHGVEGDEKQNGTGGKEKVAFKREELSAILRFGAEKLFEKDRESALRGGADAPVNDAVGVPGSESKPTSAAVSERTADDDKEEEKRVLEVDDIDELLARVPVDEANELGAAEPSAGDSLLNAFKWADFKTVEEEEDLEVGDVSDKDALALEAAKDVANIEDKRAKDITKAKEADAMEKEMLKNEGDPEFWKRVLPKNLNEDANGIVLATRQRKKPMSYGADSPQIRKRKAVTKEGSKSRKTKADGRKPKDEKSNTGELDPKEERALLRSFRRFGNPKRAKIILWDAGLESRMDESITRAVLEAVLETARKAVEAYASESPNEDGHEGGNADVDAGMANGNSIAKDDKGKSSPKVLIDVLSETNVDAVDLIQRCDDLRLLGKQIARFEEDTRFRLQRPAKAPAYGIRWMPQLDAMLLVGVHRHGFGNWSRIAEDADLRLTDKINVPGNLRYKEGAPDVSKLNRRVITLLKELESQAQPLAKSKSQDRRAKSQSKRKETVASKKRHRSNGKEISSRSKEVSVVSEETPAKKRMSQRPLRERRMKVIPDV